MRLRPRLIAALAGSGVVALAATGAARYYWNEALLDEALRQQLEARADAAAAFENPCGRERDFATRPRPRGPGFGSRRDPGAPDGFGGPPPGEGSAPRMEPRRPGPPLFFYSRDFTPLVEGQPALPDDVRTRLARGARFARSAPRPEAFAAPRGGPAMRAEGPPPGAPPGPPMMTIGAMRTGWTEPACAFVATFGPASPGLAPTPVTVGVTAVVLGILAGAIYAAAASPVRRIRALAVHVRDSARARYATGVPIEGDDEVADLSRAFNEASAAVRGHVETVERREKTLRDFVAHTHHDLGVPLSVLAGHLATIRAGADRGDAVPKALAAAAIQETQYIASLLGNLGTAAQLESEAGARRDPVDLAALVERVALRHRDYARSVSVEFNHAIPETRVEASGDVTLLEQALNNLVHNALRHNRAGGHAAVTLEASPDAFAIRVVDDGPGVAPAELARLGEPRFRSAEARSRRPEGRGLGLSIAGDVAARHGFTLTFESGSPGLRATLSGPRAASAP